MEPDLYTFLRVSDQLDSDTKSPTLTPPQSEIENPAMKMDYLFDELILNEFNEKNGYGLGNLHVSSIDKHYSLATKSGQTANVSFPQNTISLATPDPFDCTLNFKLEELPTHLVSPAITPKYNVIDPLQTEQYFTPLTSPALPPSFGNCSLDQPQGTCNAISPNELMFDSTTMLTQQLAHIEAQQQRLREQMELASSIKSANTLYRQSPLGLSQYSQKENAPVSPILTVKSKVPTLLQRIAQSGPTCQQLQGIKLPTTPATPASLMNMHVSSNSTRTSNTNTSPSTTVEQQQQPAAKKRRLAPSSPGIHASSPRALKPLLSPFLRPDLLHSSILPQQPSIGVENRRSAHKVAEQKRRDTLKQSFDSLRAEIADVLIQDSGKPEQEVREEKEKQVKFMSKVLLLQHSYEYIVRLKTNSQMKGAKLTKMHLEIEKLRKLAANSTGFSDAAAPYNL